MGCPSRTSDRERNAGDQEQVMKCLPDYGRHNKSANHALLQPFLTGKAHQMAMYAFGTTICSRWFRRHHAFTLRAADTSARSQARTGQQQVGFEREVVGAGSELLRRRIDGRHFFVLLLCGRTRRDKQAQAEDAQDAKQFVWHIDSFLKQVASVVLAAVIQNTAIVPYQVHLKSSQMNAGID